MLVYGGLGKPKVCRLESPILQAWEYYFAGLKLQRPKMGENKGEMTKIS